MRNIFILSVLFLAVFTAPAFTQTNIPAATCKESRGSLFKPCICNNVLPASIKYRVSMPECGGAAASVLFDELANSFSVVLRDRQNRDRVAPPRYHGCTARETKILGLNKCSAYKCQKVIETSDSSAGTGTQQICCFGESGTSRILRGASRMTIKIKDIPGSTRDPLIRVCLKNFDPTQDLN